MNIEINGAFTIEDAPPARPSQVATRELVVAAAVVVLAEWLLWPGGYGLGGALLVLATPAVIFAGAGAPRRSARGVTVGLLLAAVALRLAWQPGVDAVLLAAVLTFALIVSARGRRATLPELAADLPLSVLMSVSHATDFARALRARVPLGRARRTTASELLVPAAVAGVFALVLGAANPLLARVLDHTLEAVVTARWLPSLPHFALWVAALLGGITLLRPLTRVDDGSDAAVEGDAPTPHRVALARNTLAGANAVFIAHNAIDARYLWRAELPPGVGHTAYAHEGTFWLTVALALSTAVIGWALHGSSRTDPAARGVRALAYAWVAQDALLAAGAYARTWNYIDYSGLTTLRLVGVAGTTLVVAGLGLLVRKVQAGRSFAWLLRRQCDALVIALVLFTALPTEAFVARFNTVRIARGERRPLLHLYRQALTAEGAPELIPLLASPDPVVRAGVAARLVALRRTLQSERSSWQRWTSWSASTPRALARLDAHRASLDVFATERDRRLADAALSRLAWESNR